MQTQAAAALRFGITRARAEGEGASATRGSAALRETTLRPLAAAPLAFVLIAAALLSGLLGYLFARHSDAQLEVQRRQALVAAVRQYRAETGATVLDARLVRLLEQTSGLAGLRLDADPGDGSRAVQSLIEDGRIVGWVSWQPEAPATGALTRLWPLLALGFLCLSGAAGIGLWQWQRSRRLLLQARHRVQAIATDRATGLPSAVMLQETFQRAWAQRRMEQHLALMLLDLERCDGVADGAGKAARAHLSAALAARLRAHLSDAVMLAALGAGRFAVLAAVSDRAAGLAHAERLRAAACEPIAVGEEVLTPGGWVGLACAPEDGTDFATLLRRAELALAAARRGGAGVRAFDGAVEATASERQALRRALEQALTAGEGFAVAYQPIVAAEGYRIVGVEALLRWTEPRRGPIAPSEFVPLAEEAGLMPALGDFVLRRALSDAARWPSLYVAINLSPVQLHDPEHVAQIAATVRASGIAPERVVLEITEGVLIDNPEAIRTHLEMLRASGLRIALDDFGAGYSSLAYLRSLPVDRLKIDKGFVDPLGRSGDAGVVLQAMVALGRALGLRVVGEGVTTEQQRVLLRLSGCDEMQGFLFGGPVPPEEIDRRLADAEQVISLDRALRRA